MLEGFKDAATLVPAAGGASAGGAPADPAAALRAAVKMMALYKAGIGAGCAATVRALCANALASPAEPKFRRVDTAKAVIRERMSSVRGGLAAMTAAGWLRGTGDDASLLLLPDEARDEARLRMVIAAIDEATVAGAFN